jgi:hypothetical protein
MVLRFRLFRRATADHQIAGIVTNALTLVVFTSGFALGIVSVRWDMLHVSEPCGSGLCKSPSGINGPDPPLAAAHTTAIETSKSRIKKGGKGKFEGKFRQ